MKFIKHQSAACSLITVTTTATALFTLMNTAGSVTNSQAYCLSPSLNGGGVANGLFITPEDGDIRLGYGFTPTGSTGTLLSSGTKYFIPNIELQDIKLIRTSGDVVCSIDICQTKPDDVFAAVAEAVTLEASSITIGDVTADITKLGGEAVPADNATAGATPKTLITGGIYKDADDTYDDNDAVPFHFTASGELRTAGGSSVSSDYRATTNGNGDCTVVYTSGTTLTVSGAPFTIQNEDLVYIREVDATGNTATLWVNGSSGVHMEISSNVITRSGGSDFSANGVYEVGYNGQNKGYTPANTSNRTQEVSPLDQKYIGETLLDLTNIDTNTTAYGYIDMAGASGLTIQGETSGGTPTDVLTVTIEGTCQDDGTAQASCAYQDITALCYDSATNALGTTSWADTDFLATLTPAVASLFKYVRVKYVTSNDSGNDCDLTVYTKKAYI